MNDVCRSGVCVGEAVRQCGDDDACTLDLCNEEQDVCEHTVQPIPGAEGPPGTPSCSNKVDDDCDGMTDEEDNSCYTCRADSDCDDGIPCTEDHCQVDSCQNPARPAGTPCDDGLFCTVDDACQGTACVGTPNACDDGSFCTTDSCVEGEQRCDHLFGPRAAFETCGDGLDQDCDGVTDECCLGNGTFQATAPVAAGAAPWAVAAADLNRDHILDLVVANHDAGTVSVLLGNGAGGMGDGTFGSKTDYPAGSQPTAVAVADLNADRILDLVVANGGAQSVSVLLGNGLNGLGDGSFGSKTDFAVGGQPEALAIGDFNADRIPDLAVANAGAATVSILLGSGSGGRGTGAFGAKVDFPTCAGPSGVVAADFDGDHVLDLAISCRGGGQLGILLGLGAAARGTGAFASAVDYPTGDGSSAVAAGDFNGDVILDLAVANSAAGTVSVLLGNGGNGQGDGTFAAATAYPAATGVEALAVADVDADHALDLLAASPSANQIGVLRGNWSGGWPDGTFSPQSTVTANGGPRGLAVADFDADGIADLATAGSSGGSLEVFFGRGSGARPSGGFGAPLTVVDLGLYSSPTPVALGDINRDGLQDLGLGSLYLGSGANGRWDGTLQPLAGTTVPQGVQADINRDGILDSISASGSQVTVIFGGGSQGRADGTTGGSMTSPVGDVGNYGFNFLALTVGDFNTDGILDIASGYYVQNYSGNYPNYKVSEDDFFLVATGNGVDGRGDGTFTQSSKIVTGGFNNNRRTGDYPSAVYVMDVNSDGISDVLYFATQYHQDYTYHCVLDIFLGGGLNGRGDGTFTKSSSTDTTYGCSNTSTPYMIADFNSDGIQDLLSWTPNGYTAYFQGNGSGGRGDGTLQEVLLNVTYLSHVADANGDGILDLLLAGTYQPPSLSLGNGSNGRGDGTFGALVAIPVPYTYGGGATLVDLTGDAILDLVATGSTCYYSCMYTLYLLPGAATCGLP
jgi:hypothetical protein